MKKKVWIGTLLAFALLSVSVLLMVACKKKEPPQAPTGLSSYVSGSTIIVSWNSVEDADDYEIRTSNGSFYDGKVVYGTSFTDYSPREGDNHYYVTARNEYGYSAESETSCYYSGNSGGGSGSSSDLPVPTNVSAEVNGSRVYVTWSGTLNAGYYNIYRSTSSNGPYSEIGYVNHAYTYYYDDAPNSENYYKITSYTYPNESEMSSYAYCYYSGGGGGGGGGSAPSAPTGVSAEVSGSQIRVSWNSVSNATRYTIYYSSTGGNYSYLSSTSNTYYYDSNPSADNYYKVKAENSYGESSYSSYAYCHYSSGGGGGGGGSTNYAPCPPSVSASGTASSITVSWTKAAGTGCGNPTSYKVYKRNPFTSSYELKTTTSSTSYRDTDVHPGINRYAVEAINNYGSDEGYGYSSSITLPKPSSFTAQKSGSDYVKFTWSKVSQASGYQIFVSTSASGNYTILDQIDDVNTTTHTRYYPGESGHTYYFKMRAVWIVSGTYEYSDMTTYKSVTF